MPKRLEKRETDNHPLTDLIAERFEITLDRAQRSKVANAVKIAYRLEHGEDPHPCYRLNKRKVREYRSAGYTESDLVLIRRVLDSLGI